MCLLGVQVITENLTDLRKVVAMRDNRPGAALVGGAAAGEGTAMRLSPALRARRAAGPFPIPERFKDALGRFDEDQDGKLAREEIDAMPEGLRNRVRQAIQRRLGGEESKPASEP
jgi:hypothetical protein